MGKGDVLQCYLQEDRKPLRCSDLKVAKPAVSFGGKFRIIDFALSNCANSGISTVGVLTQYCPYLLHSCIKDQVISRTDERGGGISILPPFATQSGGAWYLWEPQMPSPRILVTLSRIT